MNNSIDENTTLVIPTFNRYDLISETIESALNQTRKFSEIIVVNDGSTDNTLSILNKYVSRIRVITTANLGVQSARNTGVAAAQTDWVTLCDSDDLLEENYLEKISQMPTLGIKSELIYCNFVTFRGNSVSADKFSQSPTNFFEGSKKNNSFISEIPHLYKRSIEYQPLFPSGMLFKKSFFERIGGYNVKFNHVGAEDWEFTLRAISESNVAVYMDPLVRIRKHDSNDSADSIRMSLGEALILEFGLKNHRGADIYSKDILESIERRRLGAFHGAFSNGNFMQALSIELLLKNRPSDLNFIIKSHILTLPTILRWPIWWLSQKI